MFTFLVISCNRLHYTRNCVNSIIEFVGLNDIDLLIVDNHTVEEEAGDYFASLPSGVTVKRFPDHIPHDLHRAMNYGIEFSRERGNPYINFVQDDYQYLYNNPNMLRWVDEGFCAFKDVEQLQTNLIWKRKHHKIGKVSIRKQNDAKWMLLKNKPICDNGFTRVDLYNKIGLYPASTSHHGAKRGYKGYVSGEAWIAKKTKGKYRMIISEPNVGMMMDCAYIKGGKRYGPYFPSPNSLYLRPFNEQDISAVKKRGAKGKFCFIENMITPWGWTPASMHEKHGDKNIVSKLEKGRT